jgi:hypothetical protein
MVLNPREMRADIYEDRVSQRELLGRIEALEGQVLINQTAAPPSTLPPQLQNLIRNGDYTHSFDTYYHNPTAGDDERFECWAIYTHAAPTPGQQLKEDSIHSGVAVGLSTALPDNGRSDAPTVDPDWKKSTGYARLGSDRTIDFPLPTNLAAPGRTYYIPMIVARRSANVSIPGHIFAGIWDNTAGKRDWLPASAFTLNAAVIGAPAATVSSDYKIIGYTDYGRTVESTVVTINRPTDPSFVSGSIYTRLSWKRIPGVFNYEIYRKTGAVYVRLSTESTASEYFDQGQVSETVVGYPVTTDTKAIAYSETRNADTLDENGVDIIPIDGVDPEWRRVVIPVFVPDTYDQGGTTDKQWLRIGLTAALTGADAIHGLYVDLVAMAEINGLWTHHPEDEKGAQNPASAPTGSSQGGSGTGGGGGGIDPGQFCPAEDEEMIVIDRRGRERVILAIKAKRGMRVLTGLGWFTEILAVEVGEPVTMYLLETKLGFSRRASGSDRIIQREADKRGREMASLLPDQPVRTYLDGKFFQDRVERVKRLAASEARRPIKITLKGADPTYIAGRLIKQIKGKRGGIVGHNAKLLPF